MHDGNLLWCVSCGKSEIKAQKPKCHYVIGISYSGLELNDLNTTGHGYRNNHSCDIFEHNKYISNGHIVSHKPFKENAI